MHKLITKNIDEMTGECSECGLVKLYKRHHKDENGMIRWSYYICAKGAQLRQRVEPVRKPKPKENKPVLPKKPRHKIISRNADNTRGVCAICGDIKLIKLGKRMGCPVTTYNAQIGRHGLTNKQAKEYIKGKRCAICKSTKRLCVDHCHNKNKIRDVLCRECNLALGIMHDDIERLEKAAAYLRMHNA